MFHPSVQELASDGQFMAVWCTIRTFAAHAKELGNEQPPEPIFFVKPDGCRTESDVLHVSKHPGEVHLETECVVRLTQHGDIDAVAIGLDLTDRAAQSVLRADGLPWAKGKTFRQAAVLGTFYPWRHGLEALTNEATALRIECDVNGERWQEASLSEMSITPADQVTSLMTWAPVSNGDLLYTGTPQGVARLKPGDVIEARLIAHDGELLSTYSGRCS